MPYKRILKFSVFLLAFFSLSTSDVLSVKLGESEDCNSSSANSAAPSQPKGVEGSETPPEHSGLAPGKGEEWVLVDESPDGSSPYLEVFKGTSSPPRLGKTVEYMTQFWEVTATIKFAEVAESIADSISPDLFSKVQRSKRNVEPQVQTLLELLSACKNKNERVKLLYKDLYRKAHYVGTDLDKIAWFGAFMTIFLEKAFTKGNSDLLELIETELIERRYQIRNPEHDPKQKAWNEVVRYRTFYDFFFATQMWWVEGKVSGEASKSHERLFLMLMPQDKDTCLKLLRSLESRLSQLKGGFQLITFNDTLSNLEKITQQVEKITQQVNSLDSPITLFPLLYEPVIKKIAHRGTRGFYQEGKALLERGHLEEARTLFETILKDQTLEGIPLLSVQISLADTYFRLKRFQGARTHYAASYADVDSLPGVETPELQNIVNKEATYARMRSAITSLELGCGLEFFQTLHEAVRGTDDTLLPCEDVERLLSFGPIVEDFEKGEFQTGHELAKDLFNQSEDPWIRSHVFTLRGLAYLDQENRGETNETLLRNACHMFSSALDIKGQSQHLEEIILKSRIKANRRLRNIFEQRAQADEERMARLDFKEGDSYSSDPKIDDGEGKRSQD